MSEGGMSMLTDSMFFLEGFCKSLEEQNLDYCIGKTQLRALVMRCHLKPALRGSNSGPEEFTHHTK